MAYFPTFQINQNVIASTLNSFTGVINAGQTISGNAESTLGFVGIQINFNADQNCTLYIDQSMDGIVWDITDSYNFLHTLGGFSTTVQATASYFRIRAENTSATNTTYSRFQTALCPIVEAVPRSLDEDGHFKTVVEHIRGYLDADVGITPMGDMRVSQITNLVGSQFGESTILDPNFWTSTTAAGGSVVSTGGQLKLSTGTSAANTLSRVQTIRKARYVDSVANQFRAVIEITALSGLSGVNTARWGAFDDANGFFFELSGATTASIFSLVSRSNSADTQIQSGSFNGSAGTTFIPTLLDTYEVYFTNEHTWFIIDNKLIHKATGITEPLSQTLTLPVRMECFNAAANRYNNILQVRAASISRLGDLNTQSTSKYIDTSTTSILKYGAGNIHQILLGLAGDNSASITICDNIIGNTGNAIYRATMFRQTNPLPLDIDLKGLPFSTGLTVVTAGGIPGNYTIVYE